MDEFDVVFDRVFLNEGGFQNDPEDRGNWTSGSIGIGDLRGTKFGISAMTYPDEDIENLSRDEAKEIYRRDWWDAMDLDLFCPALGYQMFDAAINHGRANAVKFLQRAVGVVEDGVPGPLTKKAVNVLELDYICIRFLAARLQFMTKISTWDRYGMGWAGRIVKNLEHAAQDIL